MISKELQKRLQSAQPIPQRAYRTDIMSIDALLGGGLSGGHCVDWSGERSCGKTGVLRVLIENIRRQGTAIAWIDTADTLMASDWSDTLPGRMWVLKPPSPGDAIFCTEAMLRTQSFGVVVMDDAPILKGNLALRLRRLARQSGTILISLRSTTRSSTVSRARTRLNFQARVQGAENDLGRRQPFIWQLTATRAHTASPPSSHSLRLVETTTPRLLSECTAADRPSSRLSTGRRYGR